MTITIAWACMGCINLSTICRERRAQIASQKISDYKEKEKSKVAVSNSYYC